jgi:uncharacterized protein (TIGR00251 family)
MNLKIKVKITPNARTDKVCGYIEKDILKIKIKAKPIDGKANLYLIKYLSKELGIPQSNFSIIQGRTSRIKMLEIKNIESKEFIEKLHI